MTCRSCLCIAAHTRPWLSSVMILGSSPIRPTGVFVQLNHSLSPHYVFCHCHNVSAPNVTFTGTFRIQQASDPEHCQRSLGRLNRVTFISMEIIYFCDATLYRHLPNQWKLDWEQTGYWRSHTHTHMKIMCLWECKDSERTMCYAWCSLSTSQGSCQRNLKPSAYLVWPASWNPAPTRNKVTDANAFWHMRNKTNLVGFMLKDA